jgi:hypothetical protein
MRMERLKNKWNLGEAARRESEIGGGIGGVEGQTYEGLVHRA